MKLFNKPATVTDLEDLVAELNDSFIDYVILYKMDKHRGICIMEVEYSSSVEDSTALYFLSEMEVIHYAILEKIKGVKYHKGIAPDHIWMYWEEMDNE